MQTGHGLHCSLFSTRTPETNNGTVHFKRLARPFQIVRRLRVNTQYGMSLVPRVTIFYHRNLFYRESIRRDNIQSLTG